MKTIFISVTALLMLVLYSNFSPKETAAATTKVLNDKEEIIDVIKKETASFYAGDYEAWKSTRAQQDYDFEAWNNSDGSFDAETGFAAVDSQLRSYMKYYKDSAIAPRDVIRKNMVFKFYGADCAYLTWDEYTSNANSKTYTHNKNLRLMEKQKGEWKIVSVASFWNYKNKISKENIQ